MPEAKYVGKVYRVVIYEDLGLIKSGSAIDLDKSKLVQLGIAVPSERYTLRGMKNKQAEAKWMLETARKRGANIVVNRLTGGNHINLEVYLLYNTVDERVLKTLEEMGDEIGTVSEKGVESKHFEF